VLGTTKIVDNGPPARRWNLVILGDGYRSTEMNQYNADVQRVVNALLSTSPFDRLRNAINVYRVNVTSTDSGADDPASCGGTGTAARTYFDASFCNNGIRRLLLVNNTTVINTANAQVPQWTVLMVIVNSAVYGGAGGAVATLSVAGGAEEIAIHEIGHTAFGLADEYEYYQGCGVDTDRNNHPASEPAEPNVTISTDRATLKWRSLVAASTPIPTTRNSNCAQCDPQASPVPTGTVGLFEGAHYYHCSAFRPDFNCKMRALGPPFCGVCRRRIDETLAPYAPPEPPVAATAWSSDRLDVFVRGTDRAVYHKWWNGTSWGPSLTGSFERMGGVILGAPVVESWGPNRLDLFAIGTDRALYHKWWNGSSWGPSLTGYERMDGVILGQPKVVSWGPSRLDVFVVGTDRALYHKWWDGSSWRPSFTGYERMGGIIEGSPEVVSWGPDRLDIFVVGTDRAIYHKWWNGSSWGPSLTGYERLGGIVWGQPKAVSWGANRLDLFVKGTDRALYHKWWNGSSWGPSLTGYEGLGGVMEGSPEAVAWGPNRLDVFVVGTDRSLYHKWWNGSSWGPSLTGYEYQGGLIVGNPTAVAWGANRLDVFVVGLDFALFHKWWNGSSWGPSLTAYERLAGTIDF
jgi:hypothetical protein